MFVYLPGQGCRGYGDSHGYGMGMGMWSNPHGSVGIPWGFSNGFQITWKRVKYSAFFCNLFYWNFPSL